MTNAERFKQVFGMTATELWSLPEKRFLEWLNDEAPEICIGIRPMTNSEILRRLKVSLPTDNSEPRVELEPITGEHNRYHGELDVRNGKLTIYGSDRCVCCGAIIPEGRMVCPTCERRANND